MHCLQVKAWRRSLHKYDTVNSHLSKGSTADASTAEAVREVLFVTTTTEPIPPGSPFSAPPGIGNTAMVDEPHCRTTDNPSPKDAPPSSRKGSFGCDKDQASVRSTSFTVRSTFNASAIKTAPKRAPLRDSTNGQDGGNQQWIPMRTKPANNTASKSKSDQSTKYPGHSFPFSHAPGSVYSPAEHESGGMAYRRPSSRSALISGLGASVRSAASDDLPFPSDTAKNTLASTQHKHFDSSTRPAAMARPYQPPHHRHASRLVTQLIAPSARAPDQHKTTIGTDKLPAHVAMMIHRRNAAYAAAAAAATASSITVVPARSTPQATLSCNGKCLVCKEAESTVLLLPCKHWSLCHGCSDQYLLTMDCSPEGPACTSLGQCPACLEHVKQHVSRLLAC